MDHVPRRFGVGYLLLMLGVAVVGVAGYTGYVVYPRFDLPAVEGAALLGLAAAAGVGSFLLTVLVPAALIGVWFLVLAAFADFFADLFPV